MALLDTLNYKFIKATVTAPREDVAVETTLENLVDTLWSSGFGPFVYDYCSFMIAQYPIPGKMRDDMVKQGLKAPEYALMLLTFTLENGQEHYQA